MGLSFALFFGQLIILFFISRQTIRSLFYFFRYFIKNDNFVFSIISLIFFPGTIVHEFGHFFMALLLMLKVEEIRIFPQWKNNQIKLGSVIYRKKDLLRAILVGIAPVFTGLGVFLWIAYFKFFPYKNLLINLFFAYLIFSISSTMFSSRQDLKDILYLIPFSIIIGGIIYIFNINILNLLIKFNILEIGISIVNQINLYLLFSIIINIFIFLFIKLSLSLLRK